MPMGFAARASVGPLLACLALVGAAPGMDADLRAIAATAGHPAGLHLHASRLERRDGRTIEATLDVDGGTRLERACSGGLCQGTLLRGGGTFAFGINGVLLPDTRFDAAQERTLLAITTTAFAEPTFAASGGTVQREAAAEPGLQRWRVRAADGAALVVDVDARSHRLARVELPDFANRTDRTVPLAATGREGLLLYAPLPYDTLERVDAPIHDPAGIITTPGADRELKLGDEPIPIVPCTIDGRSARCLLDTGASPSAISLDFAERLGREPHGEIDLAALGDFLTGAIDTSTILLGGATIAGAKLAVLPGTRGVNFDAILGTDALAALRLTFDPARRSVRIGAALHDQPPGTAIPLHFASGVPFVAVRLGNRQTDDLLFDTGDSGMLSLGYDAYRRDLALFAATGNTTAIGLGGTAAAVTGTIGEATIGTLMLRDQPIRAVRAQHGGHLGYAFASLCNRMTLDFVLQTLSCTLR